VKTCKMKLQVCSALQTPLQPDTLFGHLCWSLRYTDGEAALEDFLESYARQSPPLILSDIFPDGFWPMPLLPNPSKRQQDVLLEKIRNMSDAQLKENLPTCPIDRETDPQFKLFTALKWLQKLRFLPEATLPKLVENMDKFYILESFLENGCGEAKLLKRTTVAHNWIDRLTGRTPEEGGLHFSDEWAPDPADPPVYQLLVMSETWSADEIQRRFSDALAGGYGKSKSRGKGHIRVVAVEPWDLPHADNPDAVMLLGACCPGQTDPTGGFWQITTKYGKLGGDWALGENPFKKPLTMLKAGSLLKTGAAPRYCGRLVKDVSDTYPQVVQYAIAPALAVCCNAKEVL